MRESFVLAAVLATSSLATHTVAAQLPSTRRIDLQVADSVTRLPIAGARVTSSASVSASAVSDSAGRATLRLEEGDSAVVRVTASGFRPYARLSTSAASTLSRSTSSSPRRSRRSPGARSRPRAGRGVLK